MNHQEDKFETRDWLNEIITDPYQVIAEFYSTDDVASYRKMIKGVLTVCSTKQVYECCDPGVLYSYFKRLKSIIDATHAINDEKRSNPVNIAPSDVFNRNSYCGHLTYVSDWDYFPRTLSMKEYFNPYQAFKRFFKYQSLENWKSILDNVLHYALIRESFFNVGEEINTVALYFQLTKLLEASHLVDVRENTHIRGRLKKRLPLKNL
jgi:hypothetical protein